MKKKIKIYDLSTHNRDYKSKKEKANPYNCSIKR